MLRGQLRGGPARAPHHQGDVVLAARHVADLGRRVDDLVQGKDREVEGHHLDHRPQPQHRRPDPDPGEARFADRGVHDALVAEFLQQTLGDLVGPIVEADLLAHHEHARVPAHLLPERGVQGFAIGHDRHGVSPCTRR